MDSQALAEQTQVDSQVVATQHAQQLERVWLAVLGATEGYAEHTNTIDKVRGALKQGCTDVGDVESMLVELETTGAIAITTTADGDEIVRVNG